MFETEMDANQNLFFNQDKVQLNHSKVVFKGKNNCLILDEGAILDHSELIFYGDNALVYIKKTYNKHIHTKLSVHTGCTVFIDEGASFNGRLNIMVSEHQSLIVGKDVMFSFESWIRTSDVHAIYNVENGNRINSGKSVFIGEHVWLAQDVKVLKGATIGSGSVVGAGAVVTSTVPNNSIVAGNPSKVIRHNIFWERPSMHNKHPETLPSKQNPVNPFFYKGASNQKEWQENGKNLSNTENPLDKKNLIDQAYSGLKLLCDLPSPAKKWWQWRNTKA
ncbi:Acetyltransferase (isoleucine patch superfamily) protein [Listeria fleischmannii 1991]|jgi:acetyltransferase-like isoleucine patch superfamily enzyme|uniref:Acetyltransferase SA2342 n=2 Tax=Listeria fleischmannii TaxID=1069827 RepID=A0A2X3JCN9_9LIST|nr:acyltransferase [Listeria fleischmannii]KMT58956.1 Acetyltransferase (isoleucine patch superfamily) protein [Listeria fleischmannii 1991]SQC72110.1 Putative acetyltransferase SA2342 [Listeria fleischmannii subsp. fleischmannii]